MWSESDNHGFANELDYICVKKDDSYTFTYSFEYIAKNHGNGDYDIDTASMVVRVEWDDSNAGYVVSYDVLDMYKIDPAQGNGDAQEFHEHDVHSR